MYFVREESFQILHHSIPTFGISMLSLLHIAQAIIGQAPSQTRV